MASRYWVGGTGTWDAADTTHWSAASGGAGGASVPTAADDVFFDAASGAGTVTTGVSTRPCRNFVSTGSTMTLSLGTTLNPFGTVITIGSGFTITGAASITYSGTGSCVLTSNGRTLTNFTQSGVGGSLALADALTLSGTLTLTSGTLNTANFALTLSAFSSNNSNTRTLTLGSSSVTISGAGTAWTTATATGLTLNAGTSTITFTGAATMDNGAAHSLNNVVASGTTFQFIRTSVTMVNFTRTGTATKTDSLIFNVGATVVTGTLTLTGNSATNRLLVQSATVGTSRTVTAAAVSISNADFMDIAGAGAAAPWTGASIGDAGGNSGITFTAAATQTHTASAGGNWSDATKWTSRVPLPQDDVIVDVNTTGTLTADMPRLGRNLTFTGFVGTLAGGGLVMGSMVLGSGMAVSSGSTAWTFGGRGIHTVTTAGKSLPNSFNVVAPGGTYTLLDALSLTGTLGVVITAGTFGTAGLTVTCGSFNVTGTIARAVTLGTSTVNLTGTSGSPWNVVSTGLTLSAASSTIVFSAASASSRSFFGADQTYGTLTYTVASSPGALVITGANTVGTLNVAAGRALTLPSSTVTTVTTWNVVGQDFDYLYLPGLSGNYASTPDSAALSITGDIDIRCRAALDDWTPAATTRLINKDSGSGVTRSYNLAVNTAGALVLQAFDAAGATLSNTPSTVSPAVADGSVLWVRAIRVGATGVVTYYTAPGALAAPAPGDWTQLGTTVATTAGNIADTAQAVEIGAAVGFAQYLAGKLYRAQILNGIAGAAVLDADFTAKAVGANTFVESSAQAATVTINGAAAQAGDGRVDLASSTPGTAATLTKGDANPTVSGYLRVQDIAATPNTLTWYAGATSTNVSGNTGWIFTDMPVGAQRQALWAVRATAGQSRQMVWAVRTSIGAQRQTLWAVRLTAGAQRSTVWNTARTVGASRDVRWAVRTFVGASRDVRWQVSRAVNADRDVRWSVRHLTAADRTLRWSVATTLGANRDVRWSLTAPVGGSRQVLWSLTAPAAADLAARWDVRHTAGAAVDVRWAARLTVGEQRTCRWGVRQASGAQRDLRWALTAPVSGSRTLRWALGTTSGRDATLRWKLYSPSYGRVRGGALHPVSRVRGGTVTVNPDAAGRRGRLVGRA